MAKNFTAAEAKPLLGEFEVIIDVRSQKEWDAGHLDLPSVRFEESLHQYPDKIPALVSEIASKKFLVHCGSGLRAGKVGKLLEGKVADLSVVTSGGYSHLV